MERAKGRATIVISGPQGAAPASVEDLRSQGAEAWALRLARELDDAILHLRLNELELGVVVFTSQGDPALVSAHERLLLDNRDNDWLSREILLYWKRVLKRMGQRT